uniref:C2 domain-containing protein n=2 Tax=Plectus sambesii TaxID=2011161 RepID=A0A914W4E4_9BILA
MLQAGTEPTQAGHEPAGAAAVAFASRSLAQICAHVQLISNFPSCIVAPSVRLPSGLPPLLPRATADSETKRGACGRRPGASNQGGRIHRGFIMLKHHCFVATDPFARGDRYTGVKLVFASSKPADVLRTCEGDWLRRLDFCRSLGASESPGSLMDAISGYLNRVHIPHIPSIHSIAPSSSAGAEDVKEVKFAVPPIRRVQTDDRAGSESRLLQSAAASTGTSPRRRPSQLAFSVVAAARRRAENVISNGGTISARGSPLARVPTGRKRSLPAVNRHILRQLAVNPIGMYLFSSASSSVSNLLGGGNMTPTSDTGRSSPPSGSMSLKRVPPSFPLTRTLDVHFEIPTSASHPYLSRSFYLPAKPTASSLGSLNPDLYNNPEEGDISEYPDGHIGRIWFTVEHDRETEKLLVTISKIRNLPSRDPLTPNVCDAFVRMFVLPDERRHQDTKVRRKSCHPNFGEQFSFDVSKESLMERSLKMLVLDIDPLKRHLPLGTVEFPLSDYVRCKKNRLTVWRDLKYDSAQSMSQNGELHCSLCYNPTTERLTLVLIEAKNLQTPENDEQIDTYGKVTLSMGQKQVKTKKTRVIKKTNCPTYNEAFDYKITANKLDQICLTVQIMQAKPEKQLGRLMLAGQMFARGKQLSHWVDMIAKEKEVVPDWHFLTE